MILAGIDEAGYGPLLGPLVVTGVALEIPDALADANLWDVLRESVSASPGRHDLRLPIADSKKLFNRKKGLTGLERTALVMLQTTGRQVRTLRSLLDILTPGTTDALGEYPWYAQIDDPLPRESDADAITLQANAVRRDWAAADVRLAGVYTELLPEGHFNRRVGLSHNKATVLMESALAVVQRALHNRASHVRVVIDRHGGREHYVEPLLTYFQGADLRILEETPQRSAYEIKTDVQRWTIEFFTEGETHHLPIALASICSKYLRELLMGSLNAFFRQHDDGLKPTAGYYTDAKRFLADVAPTIQAKRLDQNMLVRCR